MVNLAPYNTFGVSCLAKEFLEINDIKDIPTQKALIIGKGANILFTKDFDGTVVKNNLMGKKDLGDGVFEVASGEDWIDFVSWVTGLGWSGIENLAYIPGTVGAAPVQNIAAYGQTSGEAILSVTGLNLETLQIETLSNPECKFYYRNSIFKNELKDKFFVTSVTFKLSRSDHFDTNYYSRYESLASFLPAPPYTPKIVAEAVTKIRKTKMPDWTVLGTAGSFFKNPFISKEKYEELKKKMPDLQVYPVDNMLYPNPDDPILKMADMVKIPAGRLLDELGWKGKRIGNVGTFEKHALIVINYGGASGQEILDFTQQMQDDIKKNFDITLEPEVNII